MALFEGLIFGGAYIRRGLSTEGNLCFKNDWASLIVGSEFTVFALFYFVYEGNFPSTSLRGLIFGGAYFRNFTVFWMYLRGYMSFGVIGYSWACTNMTWSLSLSHRWLIYPEIKSKLKKKVYDRAVKFKFPLLHIISSFRLRLFTWRGYPFPTDLVEFHQADRGLVWSLPAPIVHCLQGNNHVTNSFLPAFEENGSSKCTV